MYIGVMRQRTLPLEEILDLTTDSNCDNSQYDKDEDRDNSQYDKDEDRDNSQSDKDEDRDNSQSDTDDNFQSDEDEDRAVCGIIYPDDSGFWIGCDGCNDCFDFKSTNIKSKKHVLYR